MPLKHFTETFLVVVLGVIIALTGFIIATLPPLPQGALPWSVVFLATVAYPLVLHSLFQKRRADNLFRSLHWFPSVMMLVWLVVQIVAIASPLDTDATGSLTWGWMLWGVLLGFILLIWFCIKVIRRWAPRLFFLLLILLPFVTLAIVSELNDLRWEKELTATLWGQDFWKVDETGLIASWFSNESNGDEDPMDDEDEEKNLDPSENPDEETWREKLRMLERREQRISARMEERDSTSSSSVAVAQQSSSSAMSTFSSTSSMPSTLPESGFSWAVISSVMLAGYTGKLHTRQKKRSR